MNNDYESLIASEQAVIGSILVLNDCFDDIDLKPSEFFLETHRTIYAGICNFLTNGEPVDIILLAEHLQKKGNLDRIGGLKYIGELVQNAVSMRTVSSHAKQISKGNKLRKISLLADSLQTAIGQKDDIDSIVDLVDSSLSALIDSTEETFAHVGQAVAEAVDWADSEHKGMSTGLRDLDNLTGGLVNSDLIILAARPSQGKTALVGQIAEHVAKNNSVVFFSLEMSRRQLGARMLQYHTSRVGKSQAIAHLYALNMHIDDKPAITISHIRSQCRKIKRKQGLDLVVVDYLQLMQGKGNNREQEIGEISRGLKAIAKEFDIPVIALSQLSRRCEERLDKRPMMSDLRDSGQIEQDADLILFIYRDETYNPESDLKGLGEVIVRKNRNGSTGDITLQFDGPKTRFSDYNGERILRVVPTKRGGFTI